MSLANINLNSQQLNEISKSDAISSWVFHHIEELRYDNVDFPDRILMGWLKRIIINTSIDALRRNRFSPEIEGIPENALEEPDNHQKADEQILYKDLISYVKNLPPQYQIVFNMFAIEGWTHYEIADTLGISVGTSRSNL
jgi:RNA polymerase sigma factor (sigma-70 family)